jgi:hypothetical protein
MKVDLRGLLFLARRHLLLLDSIMYDLGLSKEEWGYEVNEAQLILDELIEHVSQVQTDNSKLNEFAELYCLIKPVHPNVARVDAIWDEAVNTPQPAPIKRNTTPIHDLVIIDLIDSSYASGRELLMKELNDRKAIGLAEYGTPLQAHNGRDCEKDSIEEMADMICYLKQGMMEGKDYLQDIYWRAVALAVDTINLRAIHQQQNELKATLATAPYYNVVVEVDGVQVTHKVRGLSGQDAAKYAFDQYVCPPSKAQPDSVKLISHDLA